MRLLRDRVRPASLVTSTVLVAGVLAGCVPAAPSEDGAAGAAEGTGPVVVVAVGDIACTPGAARTATTCRQGRTARLAASLDPDVVLTLGDQQYDRGGLREFRRSYARSWGDLRDLTYPVPGNHEYRTSGARGYYRYFEDRQPGAPGYYAVDVGRRWRVYALNSNCDEVRCRKQYRWLREDLAEHPRDCSLFTMHHPRWSSGLEHGSDPGLDRFFTIAYRHHVDLVLAGHDHDYERFVRLDPDGDPDPDGVMEIVSGAGGKSHYAFGDVEQGSAYREADAFGVLRLALRRHRFTFSFHDVDGAVADRGTRRCH